jgi:ABC-2 type transport system ATP-binding protein
MFDGRAVRVEGLRVVYGNRVAVDDLSFSVSNGEIVALVGHNGAGKSTTVEVLEGHRSRQGGRVEVLGFDPATGEPPFRQQIGIVLQESGIGSSLTVAEAVELFTSFWGRPRRAEELLEMVGLLGEQRARVTALSGGQRRRLDLALALVGRPSLVFLDEPTTGYDPVARREAWGLIRRLRDSGTTVLLTTHDMAEAEFVADRAIVMARGRLVAQGTATELAERVGASSVISFRVPDGFVINEFRSLLPGLQASELTVADEQVQLRTRRTTATLEAVVTWAVGRGIELESLTVARPTLEDVYFGLAVDVPAPDQAATLTQARGPAIEAASEPSAGAADG